MDRAAEIEILKTLLHYLDTKTTCMAEAPWRNEVTAFTCPERNKREQDILIRQRPLIMGLSCDWPKPGSYRTEDYAGVPILTVRGRDGKLRAFLNACRHRGAKVAQGCGSAGTFTCPYHGWTYGTDGMLRGIPEEAPSFPGIRAERPGLTPLPLAEKYGMVWVLPTPAANRSGDLDIDPWLNGLGPDLAFWKLDGYHFHDRHVHYEEMNWKLLVDTFHEGYHFGFLHKESLSGILVHNVGHFTPYGPNFRLVFGRTKLPTAAGDARERWDLMWNSTIVYSMFANTILAPQGGPHGDLPHVPVDRRLDRALMETSL
jgi:nitrite reductase/ring-hydroxylating ferredoxin subunit